MQVAFYAPMKPPDHPVPSGDRRVARLLIEALARSGHRVELACRLRSRDGRGDPARQERLKRFGAACADLLLRRYRRRPPQNRPDVWLTYHLYYKAPDWIGPAVARALAIPYIVAEASVAAKRAGGPWDAGHRATLAALERAALVIGLNPADSACLPDPEKLRSLPPFIDTAAFRAAAASRGATRDALAARFDLDRREPWLVAAGMMRQGDKLESYRILGAALQRLDDLPWQLLVIGDGPARAAVEQALSALGVGASRRLRYAGELAPEALPSHFAACDIMAWPAVREAFGMALLEGQAAGLPVVAGASGGVPAIVRDGTTGLLTPEGDTVAFAAALRVLLSDPARRRAMAAAAPAAIAADHDIGAAANRLDGFLREACGEKPGADLAGAATDS